MTNICLQIFKELIYLLYPTRYVVSGWGVSFLASLGSHWLVQDGNSAAPQVLLGKGQRPFSHDDPQSCIFRFELPLSVSHHGNSGHVSCLQPELNH